MRWFSRLFCWQRCYRLLREIYCFPAAIVRESCGLSYPEEEASWPWSYPAHTLWQESVGCNNGCLAVCLISQNIPWVSCPAEARPVSRLCVHCCSRNMRLVPSDKHSSLPDYAEEALSGKQESCRGPSASPFQQVHKYNALFTLSVPAPPVPTPHLKSLSPVEN